MRSVPILKNKYYHIYNRGNVKQKLFCDNRDYVRFLFLILYFQSPLSFRNIDRQVTYFSKHGKFKVDEDEQSEIVESREVKLLAFCIMPNHFHMCLQCVSDHGVSKYLHRISNAYAKYFNKKYDKTGHVFQGAYKARICLNEKYLVQLSSYIHANPAEHGIRASALKNYQWSSLGDYSKNRWAALLDTETIISRFKDFKEYENFVRSSNSKAIEYELDVNNFG